MGEGSDGVTLEGKRKIELGKNLKKRDTLGYNVLLRQEVEVISLRKANNYLEKKAILEKIYKEVDKGVFIKTFRVKSGKPNFFQSEQMWFDGLPWPAYFKNNFKECHILSIIR